MGKHTSGYTYTLGTKMIPLREYSFVRHYLGEADGDAEMAAHLAGFAEPAEAAEELMAAYHITHGIERARDGRDPFFDESDRLDPGAGAFDRDPDLDPPAGRDGPGEAEALATLKSTFSDEALGIAARPRMQPPAPSAPTASLAPPSREVLSPDKPPDFSGLDGGVRRAAHARYGPAPAPEPEPGPIRDRSSSLPGRLAAPPALSDAQRAEWLRRARAARPTLAADLEAEAGGLGNLIANQSRTSLAWGPSALQMARERALLRSMADWCRSDRSAPWQPPTREDLDRAAGGAIAPLLVASDPDAPGRLIASAAYHLGHVEARVEKLDGWLATLDRDLGYGTITPELHRGQYAEAIVDRDALRAEADALRGAATALLEALAARVGSAVESAGGPATLALGASEAALLAAPPRPPSALLDDLAEIDRGLDGLGVNSDAPGEAEGQVARTLRARRAEVAAAIEKSKAEHRAHVRAKAESDVRAALAGDPAGYAELLRAAEARPDAFPANFADSLRDAARRAILDADAAVLAALA